MTLSTPESDRYGYDTTYLRGRIIGALGGMAAEQEVFGIVTTGSEHDLEMFRLTDDVEEAVEVMVEARRHRQSSAPGGGETQEITISPE